MTRTVALIGREGTNTGAVLRTHARRLRERGIADSVVTATYAEEPGWELREWLRSLNGDVVYAVPVRFAHTYETTDAIPGALGDVPGDVRYCEPVGESPAVTAAIRRRAADATDGADGAAGRSLLLVGLGSSSLPHQRQAAERQATRLRTTGEYAEIRTCYLLQSPAIECARYTLDRDRAVAVPLFFSRSRATERDIPEKLELHRGGVAYAAPLGGAPGVTDAIHAGIERQRVLGRDTTSAGDGLLDAATPTLADGAGDSLPTHDED